MWFHNLFLSVPKVTKLVLLMSLGYFEIKYTAISFPKSILTKTLEIHVEATYYQLTANHYKIYCHIFALRVPIEEKNYFIAFCIFYTLSWQFRKNIYCHNAHRHSDTLKTRQALHYDILGTKNAILCKFIVFFCQFHFWISSFFSANETN